MRLATLFFILLFSFCSRTLFGQIHFCTWNLENFGKSKSDSAISFMANTLKEFDLIAIVEVVAGNGGAQAVAKLADELKRKGNTWDYCVSDPTSGTKGSSERYAFLWKPNKLKKIGAAKLEKKFAAVIDREPYSASFDNQGKHFTVAAFHAIPKNKQPETEIKYLKFIPETYPTETILFSGDFNCPQSHSVFNPLKENGYQPVLHNQKTSLKKECVKNECLASEYDNVFYPSAKISLVKSGVLHFYKSFSTLQQARTISDHLPVFFEFNLK